MKFGQWNRVAVATLVLLALSFAFGGGSRENALRLATVELAALPLLVLIAYERTFNVVWRDHRFALSILGSAAALPLIQLIPLPAGIALSMPGREDLRTALDITGVVPGFLPLSLTPDETWLAFLFLLPPVAAFLAVVVGKGDLIPRLVLAMLIGCFLDILLGAGQLLSGGDRFYPWATTDAGQVVGLFANRNHLATLCLVTLPFAAVWVARSERNRQANAKWLGVFYMAIVMVALAAIRSRAGVVLILPALGISMLAVWTALGRGRPKTGLVALAAVSAVVVLSLAFFASKPILQRFQSHSTQEGRFENWPYVIQAAQEYLPVGSGIGSFDPVYRSVEPLAHIDPTYFNHAHNEYLEIWLETGWLGAALLAAFFVWWARRSLTAWRGGISTARDLQRAASGAILLALLHSAADYPLRTETLAVIFAICCGVLELASKPDPKDGVKASSGDASDHRRRRRRRIAPAVSG